MERQKPKCPLIGANGNIFNLLKIAEDSLEAVGQYDEALMMLQRVYKTENYNEALKIIMEYVEPCNLTEYQEITFG